MREKLRFLGMDVHAETIAVAIAEPDGEVRTLGTIANREESVRKFIRKLARQSIYEHAMKPARRGLPFPGSLHSWESTAR